MKTFSSVMMEARSSHQVNKKQLNPKLWEGHSMKPDVRRDVLELTNLYSKELGLNKGDLEQVNVVGGNASYDFDENSDLDITMVIKPNAEMSRKRFKALSRLTSLLNYERHPKIRGIDSNVFLTLRGLNNPIRQQSIFNVSDNEWEAEPTEKEENNQRLVKAKAQEFMEQIKAACDDDDLSCHRALINKIKAFRARGLKREGEFSFANEVYRTLSRSGELDKIKGHIQDLTKRLYQFEQTGKLPKRHDTSHVPLKDSPLSLHRMQDFIEYGQPTNRGLWSECIYGAEQMLLGEPRPVVCAEALNNYRFAGGRWFMEQGEPAYISVDIQRVHQLTEDRSQRMLENITSNVLNEMASTSISVTSRRVLHEVSRRGDASSVGLIQQECVAGETGQIMHCRCCQLRFYPTLLESLYRDKSVEELEATLNHLESLRQLMSTLESDR